MQISSTKLGHIQYKLEPDPTSGEILVVKLANQFIVTQTSKSLVAAISYWSLNASE